MGEGGGEVYFYRGVLLKLSYSGSFPYGHLCMTDTDSLLGTWETGIHVKLYLCNFHNGVITKPCPFHFESKLSCVAGVNGEGVGKRASRR